MNIYDKIDNIFKQTTTNSQPEWATEILQELRTIKELLGQTLEPQQQQKKVHDYSFYGFVDNFRQTMKADVINNIYPEFEFNEEKIGVNFKGYLYYKKNSQILPADKAKMAYRYMYEKNKLNA